MRAAACVDACELPTAGTVTIAEESLCFVLPPFALRSFRVLF